MRSCAEYLLGVYEINTEENRRMGERREAAEFEGYSANPKIVIIQFD